MGMGWLMEIDNRMEDPALASSTVGEARRSGVSHDLFLY